MRYFNMQEGGRTIGVAGGKNNYDVVKAMNTALEEHFDERPVELPDIDIFKDVVEGKVIEVPVEAEFIRCVVTISESWLYI